MAEENGITRGTSGQRAPGTVICRLAAPGGEAEALRGMPTGHTADIVAVGVVADEPKTGTPCAASQAPGGLRGSVEPFELPPGGTIAHLANRAAKRWPSADLVIVFEHAKLPERWLERLCEALRSESSAATASAILDRAADVTRTRATSAPLRPRLDVPFPTCVYIRRTALDLLGDLDEAFASSYATVLDFAMRARGRGLANLLADDLLVTAPAIELGDADRQALNERHPALSVTLDQPSSPPVERSLVLARLTHEPLSVTFDARALGPNVGGTQVYLVRLLESLASRGDLRLRVLIGPDLATPVHDRLSALGETELLTYEQALERPEASHVVHRPQQVFSPDDLVLLKQLGRRVVITHHDLIAFHNPTYFPSSELWQRFLRTTRGALAAADHVLFFSNHALGDAVREDLVEPARCSVAHLGAEVEPVQDATGTLAPMQRPPNAPMLEHTPFLLCIGADYQHKNRPFALALFDELRRQHDWDGALVLAGPHVEHGSSREEESEMRLRRAIAPELAIDLSTVSEQERRWLMGNAAAVVYPTVHEGFGLVPFESAAFGVPCLFAAQSSLEELLDAELATLEPWNAARSANSAVPLLSDGVARHRHIEGLRRTAQTLRWSACAEATIAAYRTAVAAPYRTSAEGAWEALEREREIVRLDRGATELGTRLRQLSDDLGDDALALVGPRALLTRPDQHALLAVAARPALRKLLFGTLRGAFRAMRALRGSRT